MVPRDSQKTFNFLHTSDGEKILSFKCSTLYDYTLLYDYSINTDTIIYTILVMIEAEVLIDKIGVWVQIPYEIAKAWKL